MLKADRLSSLCWLALGLVSMYGATRLGLGNMHEPGSGFLAFLAGIFISVLALIVFFQSFLKGRGLQVRIGALWEGANFRRPLVIGIIVLAYILILERLGFLITSFLMLTVLMKWVEKLSWRNALLIPGLTIGVSFLLFNLFLKATLPRGIFGF